MKKNIIKFLPLILICLTIIGWAFYYIHVVEYESYKKYNGMEGVVEDCYRSRNGYKVCNIRLKDGTLVSTNYYNAVEGQTIIHEVRYNRFVGLLGDTTSLNPFIIAFSMLIVVLVYIGMVIVLFTIFLTLINKYFDFVDKNIS